jgi:hypothetical protein
MSKSAKFPETLDGLTPEEAEKTYRRLLDSRNNIKAHNDSLSKWANRVGNSVTWLAVEASTAFQAMAEKASVRNHPSVVAAVKAFDQIACPQWQGDARPEFPTDWSFEAQPNMNDGAGDADMVLNSRLANIFERTPPWEDFTLTKSEVENFFREAFSALREIKRAAGARSFKLAVENGPQRSALAWAAVDLAQDMEMTRNMLRRDLRAAAYFRIEQDLYALSRMGDGDNQDRQIEVNIFGDVTPF